MNKFSTKVPPTNVKRYIAYSAKKTRKEQTKKGLPVWFSVLWEMSWKAKFWRLHQKITVAKIQSQTYLNMPFKQNIRQYN